MELAHPHARHGAALIMAKNTFSDKTLATLPAARGVQLSAAHELVRDKRGLLTELLTNGNPSHQQLGVAARKLVEAVDDWYLAGRLYNKELGG